MTKRIFYLLHIEWNSIKQRPQFTAEGLSKFYQVYIFFPIIYHKNLNPISLRNKFKALTNSYPNLFFNINPYIPIYNITTLIYNLNSLILKFYYKLMIKKYHPDYIWITFPASYDFIPSGTKSKIIYDCMDDHLNFESHGHFIDKLSLAEKNLIKKASIIFVSSNNLANKLDQREKCKDKIILNRNAFDGKLVDTHNIHQIKKKNIYKIGYIGTISYWFDYELLYSTLENFENIEYHIIGPIDINVSTHKHIITYGSISHEDLYSTVKDLDCLIMPFKLNEMVSSVDPVKLYEYINFNKPIISVYYEEIKRFSPFVWFYNNKKEFNSLLKSLINDNLPKKYSNDERVSFLEKNTWDERIKTIKKYIDL